MHQIFSIQTMARNVGDERFREKASFIFITNKPLFPECTLVSNTLISVNIKTFIIILAQVMFLLQCKHQTKPNLASKIFSQGEPLFFFNHFERSIGQAYCLFWAKLLCNLTTGLPSNPKAKKLWQCVCVQEVLYSTAPSFSTAMKQFTFFVCFI